jgi:hypothetical protein
MRIEFTYFFVLKLLCDVLFFLIMYHFTYLYFFTDDQVELLTLKTYSEVVDEIYYKVSHLEPWERGTRKTAGMSKSSISMIKPMYCFLCHHLLLPRKSIFHIFSPAPQVPFWSFLLSHFDFDLIFRLYLLSVV